MQLLVDRDHTNSPVAEPPIIVLGATGKTGSRIVSRLQQNGRQPFTASRTGEIPF